MNTRSAPPQTHQEAEEQLGKDVSSCSNSRPTGVGCNTDASWGAHALNEMNMLSSGRLHVGPGQKHKNHF